MGKLIDEAAIRALLKRHKCPLPFHQVRAHVLGNIVSPVGTAPPVALLKRLWAGNPPAFASVGAESRVLDALVTGSWEPLIKHQEPESAFHLVRVESKPTRAGLAAAALTRRQEIDGFVDGLFGETDKDVEFPERAEDGLRDLARMRGTLAEVADAVDTWRVSGTKKNIEATVRLLRAITNSAEHEIHAIVVSCARARQHSAASVSVSKTTMH